MLCCFVCCPIRCRARYILMQAKRIVVVDVNKCCISRQICGRTGSTHSTWWLHTVYARLRCLPYGWMHLVSRQTMHTHACEGICQKWWTDALNIVPIGACLLHSTTLHFTFHHMLLWTVLGRSASLVLTIALFGAGACTRVCAHSDPSSKHTAQDTLPDMPLPDPAIIASFGMT